MAEGFILNISKEMLQRLDAADKKIVQIGESAEKAMQKINEAFGKNLGVEGFIKQLNDIQQQLSKKDLKVNVDLALKNGALDSLKKQIEALGITIPVGVTATGTGGSNSAGAIPNGLNEALSRIATTIDAMNKTLASVVNIQEKMVNSNIQQGGKGRSNNTAQVQDPINFSQNAKTITERIQAIKLLQKEMFNLDTTDKNYRTTLNNLNTELTRQQTVLKNLGIEIGKIKMPKIETHKPDFAPLREEYKKNQDELKKLQSEYDKVAKKIRETEVQIANIKAGKGGMYNPTEYTENLKKRQNLSDEIKLYQDENKLITDKMRLLNQEYQAKVKAQQANNPKNIALIEKEKKEYEKLLKTISQLEKTKQKADRDIAKHGVNSAIGRKADVVSQQTYQQIQEANKRKLDLERKYGTDLLQIQQANNVKELEEVRRQGNEEIREYEKVRSKILEINKTLYENSKTLKNTKDPNLQAQINNQNQALLNERSKLATRQLELERKHGNSLLSVQTQIGQREVEFERKKQQDKIREVQQALRRRQDIERRWAQRNARLTEQKRNTADGALSFSQNEAKTIGQKLQAIKYLQNAQKSLDVTTSQGRSKFNELNREIKKTENELRRCGVQMNNFQEKSRHLFDITGQLGRALSLMFPVSQITQYVSKMVNVRKEMELQQRSLQVLLQSKDKANELWNQTLDLAVKSPFRVKELVTYTKQLAAYRIESDKLFETNKMLADVSAGLGVDMQRLILAFGQVKSASFLRGCLGKGTPIRLYNEDIKEVQNIVVGDVIMGDDNTPRNVKEIIYGKEQMYIVKQGAFGDEYRVNENHILTLQDNITATIVDVYVKDYLKDKERYNGVKISEDGNIIYYPIELIKDNIDEYFGFVIDGNKRFLLGDGTITHNTELRQFTEAGIPMLEELSKYFSEIYGKSVSVAEVFDMISKRMVTFTDVETVFQRMTGAGGVFFNMQEELSQTTTGLISNLQDSIDLMFNEMGKKNQGLINNVIIAARYLVDNWEAVGKTMKGALLTLLMYKAATIDISKNTNGIEKSWNNIKFLFSELKKNPLEFFQTFKGNIIMTALTAIIALVGKAYAEHRKYKRAIEEVNTAHQKFRKSVSDVEVGFSEMFYNGNDNIDEYRDKLQELIGIAKQSYNIEIDFKVNELETIDEVSRKFDDLKEKILSFNQLSLEFSLDFVERDDRGWGLFQDYLGTDLKDLSSSQKDMQSLASSIRGVMSGTIKDVSELDRLNEKAESLTFTIQELNRSGDTTGAKKVKDELDSITEQITTLENKLKGVDIDIVKSLFPQGVDETEYEYIQRITNAISDLQEKAEKKGIITVLGINKESDKHDLVNFNIYGRLKKYTDDLEEAEKELLAFYQSSHDDVANLVNLSLRGRTLGFDPLDLINAIKEQNWDSIDDLENIITKELTSRGVSPTEELNQILQQIVESNDTSEVHEEFKALVNILNKQSLDEEVSKYVYNGLKNIATQKEFDETTLHKMLKDAENFYKNNQLVNDKGEVILETLDLDLIPKKEKAAPLELQAWQKAYNEEVDEILNTLTSNEDKAIFLPLKIRTDLQGVATTKEKQRSVLNESIDSLTKEIEELKKANAYLQQQYNNGEITLEQYNALYEKNIAKEEKYIKHITHLRNLLGGDDDKPKRGSGRKKTINDQISLIRQLYDEFQKLNEDFGSEISMKKVAESFDKAIDEAFEGTGIDLDLKVLEHMLRERSEVIGTKSGQILVKSFKDNAEDLNDVSFSSSFELDDESLKKSVTDINKKILNNIDGLKINDKQFDVLGNITLNNISDKEIEEYKKFLDSISEIDLSEDAKSEFDELYKKIENINEFDFNDVSKEFNEFVQKSGVFNLLPKELQIKLKENVSEKLKGIKDNWEELDEQTKKTISEFKLSGSDFQFLSNADTENFVNEIKGFLVEAKKVLQDSDFDSPIIDSINEILSSVQNAEESNVDFVQRLFKSYKSIATDANIELPNIELPDFSSIKDSDSKQLKEIANSLTKINKIEIITDEQVFDFKDKVSSTLEIIKSKYSDLEQNLTEDNKRIFNNLSKLEKNIGESNVAFVRRVKADFDSLFGGFKSEEAIPFYNLQSIPEINIPEIKYEYDFSEIEDLMENYKFENPELNLKGDVLRKLVELTQDSDKARAHIEELRESIARIDTEGENLASRFGDNFISAIQNAETEVEKMALLIQTLNIDTSSLELYKDTQKIADKLAISFGGFSEVLSKQIRHVTENYIQTTLKEHEGWAAKAVKDIDSGNLTIGMGLDKLGGYKIEQDVDYSVEDIWKEMDKQVVEHEKKLNKVLEKHKEIVLTQEQYNTLFNLSWQQGNVNNIFDYLNNIEKFEEYLKTLKKLQIVKVDEKGIETSQGAYDIDVNNVISQYKQLNSDIEKIGFLLEYVGIKASAFNGTTEKMIERSRERSETFKKEGQALSLYGMQMDSLNENVIDFTTLEGIRTALEMMRPSAEKAGQDAVRELEKAIAEVTVEIEVRAKIKENEDIVNDIQNMFSGLQLGMELDELYIPRDWASSFFKDIDADIDVNVSAEDIRDRIEEEIKKIEKENLIVLQTDTEQEKTEKEGKRKLYKSLVDFRDKLDEDENNRLMERFKKYSQYLLNEQHERIKIRLETLRQLSDIEDLYDKGKYTEGQYETIKGKLQEDEQKSLAQQTWKDFEQSPIYMQMFDDIENVSKISLENLIAKMKVLKDELQLAGLPASEIKEILGAINKAEEELERRNPFRDFDKNAKAALKSTKDLEIKLAEQIKEYDNKKQEYDNAQILLADLESNLNTMEKDTIQYEKASRFVEILRKSVNNLKKDLSGITNEIDNTSNEIDIVNEGTKDFYEQSQLILSITDNLSQGFMNTAVAVGKMSTEMKEQWEIAMDIEKNLASAVGGVLKAIYTEDKVGGIMQALSGVMGLIEIIVNTPTRKLDKQLKRQERLLQNLQNEYDKLNEAMDEAWNTRKIRSYNNALKNNYQEMLEYQDAAIEAAKDKKDADVEGTQEWLDVKELEKEREEIVNQWEDTQKQLVSKLTGGVMDDILSASESWVDAWYEAFKETGDGLKGLEENFHETFLSIIKRQAAMKISGYFIDEWNKVLERYSQDGALSNSEIKTWANIVQNDLPALNSQLETFFSSFGDMIDDTQYNLSGLTKGIQGITESQADILASYLNSIRFIVSDSNAQLKLLVSAQTGATTRSESPMVEQLRVIAQQTSAINTLLGSLVKGGHSLGGVGLKVFI